jgi:hypothetical protein
VGTCLCSKYSAGVCPIQDAIIVLPEEEMKLRDEDKQWFAGEIARQLKEVVDSFKPHGWRKLVHFLRELGPIIGTFSFVLALIVAIFMLAIFGFSGRTEEATFRGKTEEKLRNLEASLTEIKGELVKQRFIGQAILPSAQFKATLPDIRSSIAAAKQQNLKIPATVVEDIAHKMATTDTNAPAFWPTAAAVISYQSSLLVGGSRNWSVTLPVCPGTVDLLGADKNATVQSPGGPKIPIERIGNQDCYVELDGKSVSKWDCKRCLVKYSGGPISLTDVHFEDCLFIFDFNSRPPMRDGERFIQALLASQSQNVRLPTG